MYAGARSRRGGLFYFFFSRALVRCVHRRGDRCVRDYDLPLILCNGDIIRDVGGGGGGGGGDSGGRGCDWRPRPVVGIFSEPRIETARLGYGGRRQWTRLSVPILWSVCANRKNTGPPHART